MSIGNNHTPKIDLMKVPRFFVFILAIFLLSILTLSCQKLTNHHESRWDKAPQRVWVGADYWANRLQDWRLHQGRLECIDNSRSLRTVHLLTRALDKSNRSFTLSVQTGTLSESARRTDAWAGFLIGAGDLKDDYRMRSLIHQAHGRNGGLMVGINGKGKIVAIDNANQRQHIGLEREKHFYPEGIPPEGVEMNLLAREVDGSYKLTLWARKVRDGSTIDSASIKDISPERMQGNIALAAHISEHSHKKSFWFKNWKAQGGKLSKHDNHRFGPVLGVHYTLHRDTLRLTAQMPPLSRNNLHPLRLEIRKKGSNDWHEVAKTEITTPGWMAKFEVPGWQSNTAWKYRLTYPPNENDVSHTYTGTIRKEPENEVVLSTIDAPEILKKSIDSTTNFTNSSLWLPHRLNIRNVLGRKPDLIAYTGSRLFRINPTRFKLDSNALTDQLYLDYLYKWSLVCWLHGPLTRNMPSLVMPEATDSLPVPFINMAVKSQTAHMPPPYNPRADLRGAEPWYTRLVYGGVDLAVVEDDLMAPDTLTTGIGQKNNSSGIAKRTRQLRFLKDWTNSWDDVDIKAVVTNTSSIQHITQPPAPSGQKENHPSASGQEKEKISPVLQLNHKTSHTTSSQVKEVVSQVRKSHALVIKGGSRMPYLIHHGINDWEDAGYEFGFPSWSQATPPHPAVRVMQNKSIADSVLIDSLTLPAKFRDPHGHPIILETLTKGSDRNKTGGPRQKGFGIEHHDTSYLSGMVPGFGIVRFNTRDQEISISVWPAEGDPQNTQPFSGWPVDLSVQENYIDNPRSHLPEIIAKGLGANPVYKLYHYNQPGLIYAKRAKDTVFRPPVFEESIFTLVVGAPEKNRMDTLRHLVPVKLKKQIILDLSNK